MGKRDTSKAPAASGRRRTDAEARMTAGIEDLIAGKSYSEIARDHGVSRRQVRRWAQDPRVREALDHAREEALDVLRAAGGRAARVLAATLDAEDERVAMQAATAILDRVGVVRSERHEVEDVTAPRTIEEARARLTALAKQLGEGDGEDEEVGDGDE